MSKIALFTLSLTILTAGARSATAKQACAVQSRSQKDAVVKIGPRIVTLIGWEHLDDDSGPFLAKALKEMHAEATAGRCAEAIANARATRLMLSIQLDATREVISKIDQAHAVAPATFIGVELTDAEFAQQLEFNRTHDDRFADLESLCGVGLRAEVDQLRLMAPGPEYAFARANPRVSLEPLEDQALKDANGLDYAGEDQDTFDQNNPAMTAESLKALRAVSADVMALKSPSESDIRAVVAYEKDGARRVTLDRELRFAIELRIRTLRGAYARNTAIAARVLKLKGNGSVILGWSHIGNLVDQIIQQCEAP